VQSIPAIQIVDCNQSVALLSRDFGKSPSVIAACFARDDESDSCLLPFGVATGTPLSRAEEFMHNERVIAHSVARTLSLRHHIVRFFYLLLCCTTSVSRRRHILQKCESLN